jgi:hypothetical protein
MSITIFALGFYKSLSIYLLFLLINFIYCDASQIFFNIKVVYWPLLLAHHQKNYENLGMFYSLSPHKNYMDLHIFTQWVNVNHLHLHGRYV